MSVVVIDTFKVNVKDKLLQGIRNFWLEYIKGDKPLLLGFSGGVDSTALLSLLLESRRLLVLRKYRDIPIHVAHFDHAWREESRTEAAVLQETVSDLGLFFHSVRSSGSGAIGSNKEERAREERYAFFQKIYEKIGAQALLLAHQKEDQVETILKRIFEGASLLHIGGMLEKSSYQNMVVLRPLLSFNKEELLSWNHKQGLSYFQDSTNKDLHFLRARMREKLIPELEKWFGKGIQRPLLSLGEESQELKKQFISKAEQWETSFLEEGKLGFCLHLGSIREEGRLDRQEWLRFCFKKKGIVLSREEAKRVEALSSLELQDKRVAISSGEILIDRGSVYWIFPPTLEDWEIGQTVKGVEGGTLLSHFLRGEIICKGIASENFSKEELCCFASLTPAQKKKFSAFFAKHSVPARIRKLFPFVIRDGDVCDFYFEDVINSKENDFMKILSVKLRKIYN